MAKINGATLIARSLKEQGIDHLFGVVGFPVGPIAEAAQKEGINYVGMRNEQAASYAAQAYGYMTGRPGACIVVTGPGVVHGLAGLANAQQTFWFCSHLFPEDQASFEWQLIGADRSQVMLDDY